MTNSSPEQILEQSNLRDTQTRRMVLRALQSTKKGTTVQEVYERITKAGATINLATVYRIIEKFAEEGIVHEHSTQGVFSVCSMPEHSSHHGLVSCTECGKLEEFHNKELCNIEHKALKQAGFSSTRHLTHIMGLCRTCA